MTNPRYKSVILTHQQWAEVLDYLEIAQMNVIDFARRDVDHISRNIENQIRSQVCNHKTKLSKSIKKKSAKEIKLFYS